MSFSSIIIIMYRYRTCIHVCPHFGCHCHIYKYMYMYPCRTSCCIVIQWSLMCVQHGRISLSMKCGVPSPPPPRLLLHTELIVTCQACSSSHYEMYVRFGASQISCFSHSADRALCLECSVSWVWIPSPPPPQLSFLWKRDCFGCFVRLCFVCLSMLASCYVLPYYLLVLCTHV